MSSIDSSSISTSSARIEELTATWQSSGELSTEELAELISLCLDMSALAGTGIENLEAIQEEIDAVQNVLNSCVALANAVAEPAQTDVDISAGLTDLANSCNELGIPYSDDIETTYTNIMSALSQLDAEALEIFNQVSESLALTPTILSTINQSSEDTSLTLDTSADLESMETVTSSNSTKNNAMTSAFDTFGISTTVSETGEVTIDEEVSIQKLYAALQLGMSNVYKEDAEYYMAEIEEAQALEQECAEMVAEARAAQEAGEEMSAEMEQFFIDNDIPYSEDDWDYNLESLTDFQETVSSETQLNMVYLQEAISYYNSFLQGASSTLSDYEDSITSITNNIT